MSISEDELEVAKLAAAVSGALKHVDSTMLNNNNTNGQANRIDPRSFLPAQPQQRPAQRQLNVPNMIQQQVSRPLGAEVVGTEQVNVADLVIPMDGLDAETRKLVAQHMRSEPQPPTACLPENRLGPTPNTIAASIKAQTNETFIREVIKEIETEPEKAYQYLKRKIKVLEKKLDQIIDKLGIETNEQI